MVGCVEAMAAGAVVAAGEAVADGEAVAAGATASPVAMLAGAGPEVVWAIADCAKPRPQIITVANKIREIFLTPAPPRRLALSPAFHLPERGWGISSYPLPRSR